MSNFHVDRALLFAVLLVILSWPAESQFISFGAKGGVPLTDPLETGQGGSGGISHDWRRYVVGPTGELHLPFGLSVEVDALYRPLNFTTSFASNVLPSVRTTGSDWQFPFLAKYTFRRGIVIHPFIDGGVTYRHVSFSNVPVADPDTAGISLGGG